LQLTGFGSRSWRFGAGWLRDVCGQCRCPAAARRRDCSYTSHGLAQRTSRRGGALGEGDTASGSRRRGRRARAPRARRVADAASRQRVRGDGAWRRRASARPARSVSWLLARSAWRVTGHEHGVAVGVEGGWASRAPAASRQKHDEVLSKTGVAARWRSMAAAAQRQGRLGEVRPGLGGVVEQRLGARRTALVRRGRGGGSRAPGRRAEVLGDEAGRGAPAQRWWGSASAWRPGHAKELRFGMVTARSQRERWRRLGKGGEGDGGAVGKGVGDCGFYGAAS